MIHNIAHRGASAYEPENTLRAFERAVEMGATMLELDAHLTRDGRVVVIHDSDLSRIAGVPDRISDLTLEEVKQFDAGQGERIPTLEEVIDLVRGRAQLYIELKGQHTPEPVVEILHRMDFADQVIVGSFDPWLPQKVKFLDPAVRTSVLVGREHHSPDEEGRPAYVEYALAVDADYVHPCWERASATPHVLLTPSLLDTIRDAGLGIVLWHEERPEELRELVQLDVDGICTNTPDVLAEILRQQRGNG
ncbi:MAG: glycerophosphodiester phosphodiesterase [Anaerolineae bacterium]